MPASRLRYPAMIVSMVALVVGLLGALARLGWLTGFESASGLHGAVMVAGFLGSLIAVERAVALGRPWAFAGPILTGIGALVLAVGLPKAIGSGAIVIGSFIALVAFAALLRRQPSPAMWVMATGIACWLGGNVAWSLGVGMFRVVPSWMAFLGLTIAGERIELSRFRLPSGWRKATFWIGTATVLAGTAMTVAAYDLGVRVLGGGFVIWAAWLLRSDMALRSVRGSGVGRFAAVALLIGYGWLGISGALFVAFGGWVGVLRYDTILHSFFVGFVLSMIFGHAPIVLPAVLGVRIRYRRHFYVPLALLHVSLAIRIAGDLLIWMPGRELGGLVNVAAIVLFFATVIASALGKSAPSG